MNQHWKNVERQIARKMKGVRVSNHALGQQTPDVETTAFSVEVKSRKTLPGWIEAAMCQAEDNASDGKLPLVVLHQVGRRHDNDLVMVRLGAFVEWFGHVEVSDG